tara:strand:+ start:204876 stop:206987 length:2112 start_codon:yes stop_codon:yes gene_type:complete
LGCLAAAIIVSKSTHPFLVQIVQTTLLRRLRAVPLCNAGLLVVFLFAFVLSQASVSRAGNFAAANSGEVRDIRAKVRAAQFLSKATFGPTQEMIDTLGARITQIGYRPACEEWIDAQFALPPTSHEQTAYDILTGDGRNIDQNLADTHNYRTQAWWHIVLTGEDQLRQRVAWSLSQIFQIGDSGLDFNNPSRYNVPDGGGPAIPLWAGLANYYDEFVEHADGNYRDLLGSVTFHGNMGVWLTSIGNRKAIKTDGEITQVPDENFAREIMQLFSVGLYELMPDGRLKVDASGELIPTYDNDDITEMARVFTGFQYSDGNDNDNDIRIDRVARNWGQPMVVYGKHHDNNRDYSEDPFAPESKTVFGVTLPPLPAEYDSWGESLDPSIRALQNAAAKAEVNAALDIVADHPNVGPFISRRLIQRLVKSNPSRAYMARVVSVWNDNGSGQRGDLKAVVKAVLLDPEVLRGQLRRRAGSGPELRVEVTTRGTEHSRLREPVVRIASFIRAMRPASNWDGGYMMLNSDIFTLTKQAPYKSPSVFNFYLPDYQSIDLVNYTPSRRLPYSGVFHPEFEILDGFTIVSTADLFKDFCRNQSSSFAMTGGAGTCQISFDFSPEISMASDDSHGGATPGDPNDYDDPVANKGRMKELLERFDLLLCNGSLSEGTKRLIYEGLANTLGDGPAHSVERVESMLLAIVTSPDCAVEE